MGEQVSLARLYLLRGMYVLTFAFLGFQVWPKIIVGHRGWAPLPGVAISFYAALSVLCLLGLRYPLAMLPLIFVQLFYKVVWLLAVWLPLRSAGPTNETSMGGLRLSVLSVLFILVVVGDLVVVPWPYVVARFVRARGDRWKMSIGTRTPHSSQPSARRGIRTG